MDKNRILTIDLKNRVFKDSLILDIGSLKLDNKCSIDLNTTNCIESLKETFFSGRFNELKEKINNIECVLINDTDEALYKEFIGLKEFFECYTDAFQYISKFEQDNNDIELFLKIKMAVYNLNMLDYNNKLCEFKEVYDELINKVNKILNSYDLASVLDEFTQIIEQDGVNYKDIAYIDQIVQTVKFYFNEDNIKMIANTLSFNIDRVKENILQEYNLGINTENNIKFLISKKYNCLIEDEHFKKYIQNLKQKYKTVEEIEKELQNIYELYKLNNSKSFGEYYKNISNILTNFVVMFPEFYKEYISRRLFKRNIFFYNIGELNKEIEDYVSNIQVIDKNKSVPI